MTKDFDRRFEDGVKNLLLHCAGCEKDQKVLVVSEHEPDGYYDPELAPAIKATAQRLGFRVETFAVPFLRDANDPSAALVARMNDADCTVFLARLGDQIRFRSKDASMTQVISYALDRDALASPFGTAPYEAFVQLKDLINHALSCAKDIRVTCPEGTDFRGRLKAPLTSLGDVTRKRFPVSVFTPVPAEGFAGRIAQTGFLTGTGSNYYEPYTCPLSSKIFVEFSNRRITRFSGALKDVQCAEHHYAQVGQRLGIDAYCMHSWHAGIHPGCHYERPAAENFERWGGSAFGNPRLLHFHTCGDYPPGEISLNLLDPTVSLDGTKLWDNGVLKLDRLQGAEALLAQFPQLHDLFANPSTSVGQAKCHKLSHLI